MFNIFKKKQQVDNGPILASSSSAFDDLPPDIKKIAQKNIDIIADMLIDDQADELAKKIINRVLELVWNLPASESHHHSSEFGLFLHSLETAIANLQAFESKLFLHRSSDGNIDSFKTRKIKPREQYAHFLAGLLTDIGESFKFFVKCKEHYTDKKIEHLVAYFSEFSKEFQNIDDDPYLKYNVYISNMIKAINAVDDFEHNSDIDILSRESYAHFIAALLHDIGKALDFIITSADQQVWNPFKEGLYTFYKRNREIIIKHRDSRTYSLHRKVSPAFATLIISPEDYNYIGPHNFAELIEYLSFSPHTSNKFKKTIESDMQSTQQNIVESMPVADIISAVISEIRDILMSGRYPFNSSMPGAWIMEDYTAVAIKICDDARVSASKNGKIKRLIDFGALLKGFVERRYVKSEDWKCIYMMDIETQGKSFQQKVIQFKNSILWQGNSPEKCQLKLKFNIINK